MGDFGQLKTGAHGTILAGTSVVEGGDGKLWTATLREGVYEHDGKRRVHHPVKDGDAAVEVFAVYTDNRGDLWLGTHNSGAYRFDGKAFAKWRPPGASR